MHDLKIIALKCSSVDYEKLEAQAIYFVMSLCVPYGMMMPQSQTSGSNAPSTLSSKENETSQTLTTGGVSAAWT